MRSEGARNATRCASRGRETRPDARRERAKRDPTRGEGARNATRSRQPRQGKKAPRRFLRQATSRGRSAFARRQLPAAPHLYFVAMFTTLVGMALGCQMSATADYRWPHESQRTLSEVVDVPAGFRRVASKPDSEHNTEGDDFATWLRGLPMQPKGRQVRLFDGSLKRNQTAQAAVLDIDVGTKDHQQCADAVMRLRAEYLFARHREDEICFHASNGAELPWPKWKAGQRPKLETRGADWRARQPADGSWATFRKYLDFVFVYAGTWSLEKELLPVALETPIRAGDVFIQGGFPGHAVIVMDVAASGDGQRRFLIAQSYMPAQDIHVLRNPVAETPWYAADSVTLGQKLVTPEWTFQPVHRMRFREGQGCASSSSSSPRAR